MAFQAITTNQSSTYQIQDGDYFVLMPGIYVHSSGAGFFGNAGADAVLTGTTLTVLGTIASGALGVDMTSVATEVRQTSVIVGTTGAVHGALGGIALDSGGGNSILNYGEVISGGYVLHLGGEGAANRVENHGNLALTGPSGLAAIHVGGGADRVFIVNGGVISGVPGTGHALVESAAPATFGNSGQILAQGAVAVRLSEQQDVMTQSGLIEGRVELLGGADRLYNTGMVLEVVDLGDGADLYRALGTGGASDTVIGGAGADTLVGGALDDILEGGSESDLLRGQGGNDDLSGGGGADTLQAGDGNDTLGGGNENDRLLGENGDDFLSGGSGADDLFGGNGDDTLLGGDDNDRLFGGAGQNDLYGQGGRDVVYAQAGEDTIIFQSASDSAVGAQRDVIWGFDIGQDVIDLTQVAPGLLVFRGTDAFTGTAREVRLAEFSSGTTIVQVDVDGDGVQDMEVMISQITGLSETDFLL